MKKVIKIFSIMFVLILIPSIAFMETNYSRELQQAIRLYQEGKNPDAMDKFMDIMMSGTPEEKAVAREYLNKITAGIRYTSSDNKTSQNNKVEIVTVESVSPSKEGKESVQKEENKSLKETEKQSSGEINTETLKDMIAKKIKELKNDLMLSIYRNNAFKIYIDKDNERPECIVVKNDAVFTSNLTFNPKITDDLEKLAGLIMTLGRTKVTIVPEGVLSGDTKIVNIRKASVLHSYFLTYGISPAKISLDMMGSSTHIPKNVDDLSGTILLFNYSDEISLTDKSSDDPKVSLAIYPGKIELSKEETSIVELSVMSSRVPIAHWKLEINRIDGDKTVNVESFEGSEPSYVQILFNGRKKLTGEYYPAGKYVFSLTATDTKGKTSSDKKSLILTNSAAGTKKSEKLDSKKGKTLSKGIHTAKYEIYYKKGTWFLTVSGKSRIKKAVEFFKKNKNSKMVITGYAYYREKEASDLARRRGLVIKNYIVKKYSINAEKIQLKKKVVKYNSPHVEVMIMY